MRRLSKNKYLLFSLIFGGVNALAIFLIFGLQVDSDTPGYITTLWHFLGRETGELLPYRILRPLGIIFALPFTSIFSGLGALIFENVLFYLGSLYLIFKISQKILKKEKLGFYSVIFFTTAYPLLRFGLAGMVDMGAWFFYLLSVYLTLLFLEEPKNYLVYLNGLVCGMGVLVKENGGVGILFFLAILLVSGKFRKKEIVDYALKFLPLFLVPILINQLITYHYFHYTYFHWYLQNAKSYLKQSYTFFNLAKNFFVTFGLNWIFVLIGIWRIYNERDKETIKIFLSLAIPSFSFFLWPSITARLIYIAGPFLALLAARGLDSKKYRFYFLFLLLPLAIFLNFILVELSYEF